MAAYRRKALSLRHRTTRHNLPCAWCGEPIDTTLPYQHPQAFTADHVTALANGGDILGELQPMHRACNSRKRDHQTAILREAT